MSLAESSLSIICVSVRDFINISINADPDNTNINVLLGAPADIEEDNGHQVSMFFYRFEPSGFQANSHPGDPWRIRLFCLITAFGITEGNIPAGENDLRILGEILRIFRASPVLEAVDVNGETIRLQVVFNPVTDEQINQVWSTQGDTSYRPSVIYEMALSAILPFEPRVDPLLVGSIGNQARGTLAARHETFTGIIQSPVVTVVNIDIDEPLWQPVITWIYQGECAYTLSFDVDSDAFDDFITQIWVAGNPAETIQLQWEIWQSQTGWENIGAPIDVIPFTPFIDPDNIPAVVVDTFPVNPGQPIVLPDEQRAIQGMLYAVRNVQLLPGEADIQIRSNPLLISLYRNLP